MALAASGGAARQDRDLAFPGAAAFAPDGCPTADTPATPADGPPRAPLIAESPYSRRLRVGRIGARFALTLAAQLLSGPSQTASKQNVTILHRR